MTHTSPRLSVVIPTYNRCARLRQVLASLEHQRCPLDWFEVVVVSDGSTDATNNFLTGFQTPLRFLPITQANGGAAAARNRGVAEAKGKLILFLDDDVVAGPDLVSEHLRAHEAEGADVVVIGPMLTPTDFCMLPWVAWEQATLAKQYDDMQQGRWAPTARQFYTGNSSLDRQQIIDAGGFDPSFKRAEDVELAYRLARRGLRFVFQPEAAGYHYAERSFRSWITTPYLYGRNDVIFTLRKGQTWLLPTVFREFYTRHALIRYLTRLCLGRPLLLSVTIQLLAGLAMLAGWLRLRWVAHIAYSAIFNLRYYQGVSDELGGRRQMLAGLTQSARNLKLRPNG